MKVALIANLRSNVQEYAIVVVFLPDMYNTSIP